MCLSAKLHLCRILFMQYKITWIVTVEYIYAGLWEFVLIIRFSSDFWVNTECKAMFAAASFHNSSGQFCKTCVLF